MSSNASPAQIAEPNGSSHKRFLASRRSKVVAALIVIVAAVGAALAATDPFAASPSAGSGTSDNAYPTSTATVVERSLASQVQVSATLGFASSVTLSLPSGTPAAAVTQADQAAQSAAWHVSSDQMALASATRLAKVTNGGTLVGAKASVASDKAALAAAKAQLASDEQLNCPPASAATVTGTSPSGGSSGGSQQAGVVMAQPHTTAAPTVTTGTPSAVGSTTATFVGTINPNGLDTSYYFEYGATAAYGSTTAASDAGSASSPGDVSAVISGLLPDTTYAFALVATNSSGSLNGGQQTFQTLQSSCVAQRLVVTSAQHSLTQAQDALSADKLSGGASVTNAEQQLSADQAAAAAANQALSDARTQLLNPASTFTSLAAVGTELSRGSVVYTLANQPVPLFYGTEVMYRALYLGVSDGPDVAELQSNLTALGFGSGISATEHFSSATEADLKAWQSSLGRPPTGVLALGDVVIEPGPIQVDTVAASPGQAAQSGQTVMTATSTKRVVTIALDASQQSEIKVGDAVEITLPNGLTTPGVVSSIGKVATSTSASGTTGGSSSPTITVTVTPSDPAATGTLDAAPVEVSITNASVAHALVVPVNALLALSSGGYALEEIEAGGVHHLVQVTLGIFDDADGLVQVSGSEVAAGQRVVVPAA
jgi:hypothetical protein